MHSFLLIIKTFDQKKSNMIIMIIYIIAVISIILILWFQEPLFIKNDGSKNHKNTDCKNTPYIIMYNRCKLPLIIVCIIILVFILYRCNEHRMNYDIYNSIPNF